jgi:hypothetical protein
LDIPYEFRRVAAAISGIALWISANHRTRVDRKLVSMRGEIDRDLAQRRGAVDEGLATLKSQFERELAEQKAQLDNRAIYAAERVAHELLMHPAWTQRTFKAIQHRLGGFEDNELKRILVQAGAVRFTHAENEYWGLIERNREALARGSSSSGDGDPD